jgi:hypothetical protein
MKWWLAIALVGCGSNEQAPAVVDSGVDAPDAIADVAPEVEPEPIGSGAIEVTHSTREGTLIATTTARFARNIPTTAPASCTRESFGPCDVVACAPLPPPESPAYEGAGALTLSGGLLGAPLTIPKTSQTYLHNRVSEPYFKGADDLRIKALGDVVPAFEMSVTTPEDLVVTKPSCAVDCGEVDRSRDYEIIWMPPRYGTVDVTLSTGDPKAMTTVTCSAKATDGRLVIPAAALAKLRVDTPAPTISIVPRSTTTTTVEGWKLVFVTTAIGPKGTISVK